jgi:hypothetical protein
MLEYNKFKKKYNNLNDSEKYGILLLAIKYWEENGFKINRNKKIYPKDINFNNSKELILELEILNFLINEKTDKVYNMFLSVGDYNKVNFIVEKFLILNDNNIIKLRFNDKLIDYAYRLIKYQKIMLLNN